MKTYRVTEIFENGTSNDLGTFNNIEEARNYYLEVLRKDGYKLDHSCEWILELQEVTTEENDNIEDINVIESQDLYKEGVVYGRTNPVSYWYEASWNGEKQELQYTFYFQGEIEYRKVSESELENLYL